MKTTAKKSFVLYTEINAMMRVLSDEEAGMVIKAILSYNLTGIQPTIDNKAVNVVLSGIIDQLDRDHLKYQQICEKRSMAGKKGNEIRWHKKEKTSTEQKNSTEQKTSSVKRPTLNHEERITKSKERFIKAMEPYSEMYDRQMLNDFYRYWTELNRSHTKMRFEMQKTWETGKRLATWLRKSYNQQ